MARARARGKRRVQEIIEDRHRAAFLRGLNAQVVPGITDTEAWVIHWYFKTYGAGNVENVEFSSERRAVIDRMRRKYKEPK